MIIAFEVKYQPEMRLATNIAEQKYLPSCWGERGSPLLPETLRREWSGELLPLWLVRELGLGPRSTCFDLGAACWAGCRLEQVSESARNFVVNLVYSRRQEIAGLPALAQAWPRSLDTRMVPWSRRTTNCLNKVGLLADLSRLSDVTFGELFSIPAMGVTSVLDFACSAEAAFQPLDSETTADLDVSVSLLEALDSDWAAQISDQDPRFSDLVAPGGLTIYERLEKVTAEPEDPPLVELQLAQTILSLRARRQAIESLPLEQALAGYVASISKHSGKRLQALLARLGLAGQPPITLEDSGALLGLTRERMRQVQARFEKRLPDHPVFMPQLDDAIAEVRSVAPIGCEAAARTLQEKGISRIPFDPR